MKNKSIEVGPLEMKVLGLIEEGGPKGVAEIQAMLKTKGDDLAYTTIMTVLVRLYQKGILQRKKESRQFIYSVKANQNSRKKIFHKIRQTLFHGNALRPILNLLDSDPELKESDLLELKKQVNDRLKKLKDQTPDANKVTSKEQNK